MLLGVALSRQAKMMGDARGELFLVVRHHDECLVRPTAEGLDDCLHVTAVDVVETM